MNGEPFEIVKMKMQRLIKNPSKDHEMLDSIEGELRTLVEQKTSLSKIITELKNSGFHGGRDKLTNWLDMKGIRTINRRRKKQTVEN